MIVKFVSALALAEVKYEKISLGNMDFQSIVN